MTKVITYGTFDLLHQGHINILKRAKTLGDYLIVGVTSENYDKYRGKLNVKQSTFERIENIKSTGLADEIVVEEYEGQKIDDIKRLNVDIFVIGSDWIGRFDYLREFCDVIYLERTKGISSTMIRDSQHPVIKIGIAGAAPYIGKFVQESKYVSGINVECIFDEKEDNANHSASLYELAAAYSDYEQFCNDINSVYITNSLTDKNYYIKKALMLGKHVLCEPPIALNASEALELFELAKEKKIILMEAISTAYCNGYLRMISCAKSGKIGEIVSVEASISRLSSDETKETDKIHGSIETFISNAVLPVLDVLGQNYRFISFVSYYSNTNKSDLYTKVELLYDRKYAIVKTGNGVKTDGSLIISGTRGYVYVPSPWWRTDYYELRYEDPNETEKYFYKYQGDGIRYVITEFLNEISVMEMKKTNIEKSVAVSSIIESYMSGHNIALI